MTRKLLSRQAVEDAGALLAALAEIDQHRAACQKLREPRPGGIFEAERAFLDSQARRAVEYAFVHHKYVSRDLATIALVALEKGRAETISRLKALGVEA